MSSQAIPSMNAESKAKISSFISETARSGQFPAIFAGVTNAKETLFFDQAGDRVLGEPDKGEVKEDTPTEIFSQTKFITSIVEQGLVSLDSVEDIEKWLPEIGKLPVLQGYKDDNNPILVPAKNKVTLRMLLSHTAGCTYASDPEMQKYLEKYPAPNVLAPDASLKTLEIPFVFEPGTSFRYSHSIDWAGILVERVSKLRLGEYFDKYIFEPCGITSMTFFPNKHIADTKMAMCYRDAAGKLSVSPDGFSKGRPQDGDVVRKQELLSGGAALFGTQADYLRFLRGVLRSDPKFGAGDGLLKPESYAELFKPSMPGPDKSDACAKIAEMVSRAKYFDPPTPEPEMINHSVGLMINTKDFNGRRKAYSGSWSGMAKTQFWVDPTTGIAAVFGTQLIAVMPGDAFGPKYAEYESLVYAALE